MDVNDNACLLTKRVVPRSIASKLAPTGGFSGHRSRVSPGSPCGSQPAGEERPDNAIIQTGRVIVNVHREQARSYRSEINDQRTPALRSAEGVKSASL
jgi:hypothetical protein